MTIFDTLGHWYKAHQVAKQISDVEKDYIGWEVLEVSIDHLDHLDRVLYAVAIITKVEWEDSIWNSKFGGSGDWMVYIRYLATGIERSTSFSVLIETDTVYPNIDEVCPTYKARSLKAREAAAK